MWRPKRGWVEFFLLILVSIPMIALSGAIFLLMLTSAFAPPWQ